MCKLIVWIATCEMTFHLLEILLGCFFMWLIVLHRQYPGCFRIFVKNLLLHGY